MRIQYKGIQRWATVPDSVRSELEADPRRDLAWVANIAAAESLVRTQDRYLEDADASIAGWRERLDASIHYHYPAQEAAA